MKKPFRSAILTIVGRVFSCYAVVNMSLTLEEILISLDARDRTRAAIASARRNLKDLDKDIARLRASYGQAAVSGMREVNRVVDREGPSVQRRFLKYMFKQDPELFRNLARPFAAAFSVPAIAAVGAAVGLSLAGPISAAIAAGVTGGLGLATVALGAFALRENKRLRETFANAAGSIGQSLARAAEPLLPVLEGTIGKARNIIVSLEPEFRRLFAASRPLLPILVEGFGQFARAILPAIVAMMPTAVRFTQLLAAHMPKLADAFAEFLDILVRNEPVLMRTLDMTLGLAERAIPALGIAMVLAAGYFNVLWAATKGLVDIFGAAGEVVVNFGSVVRNAMMGNFPQAKRSFEAMKSSIADFDDAILHAGRDVAESMNTASANVASNSDAMISSYAGVAGAFGDGSDKIATALSRAQDKIRATKDRLVEIKDSAKENAQGMAQALESTIPAFEKVQRGSRQTASQLNANLRDQIREAQRWSTNLQALLKRGADPKFVQALSIKGPEFVAAYVRGSDRQLRTGETLWRKRERAMAAATKDAKDAALAAVQAMVDKMNHKLALLKAQVVALQGKFGWEGLKIFTGSGAPPRFARGGPVAVGTTPTADDVLARLSRGEFVVNAKAAGQHRELLERINRSPGFATGGAVLPRWRYSVAEMNRWFAQGEHAIVESAERLQKAWLKRFLSSAGGAFGSGSWMRAIGELRADRVPFNIISTFRPGARTRASGSVSYHALNRAVDLTGPNMLAIFKSLMDTSPTELIYSRAPLYKSRRGWRSISQLDPITLADHFSHVHAAYHRGGRIPEDVYGVGRSGRTYAFQGGETVVPKSGGNVHIHIHADNIVGGKKAADDLADMVLEGLQRKARRFGNPNIPAQIIGSR